MIYFFALGFIIVGFIIIGISIKFDDSTELGKIKFARFFLIGLSTIIIGFLDIFVGNFINPEPIEVCRYEKDDLMIIFNDSNLTYTVIFTDTNEVNAIIDKTIFNIYDVQDCRKLTFSINSVVIDSDVCEPYISVKSTNSLFDLPNGISYDFVIPSMDYIKNDVM